MTASTSAGKAPSRPISRPRQSVSGPSSFQPSCQSPPSLWRTYVQPAHALEGAGEEKRSGIDGPEPDGLDELQYQTFGLFVVPRDESVYGDPRTKGSACRAAKAVLKALTILSCGNLAWSFSAADMPVWFSGSGVGGLDTSTRNEAVASD